MSLTVLIVDDDADIRETLADVLRDAGYHVLGAANGDDALHQLRRGARPNLILLNLMMPVMNGWEFRERQRQDPMLAAIPVVVISAYSRYTSDGADFDAAASLRKPLDITTLIEMVERHAV